MAIEIVDFPSYKMVIFHSYVKLPEGMFQNIPVYPHYMGMGQYLLISFLGDEHPFTSYFDVNYRGTRF